MCINHQGSDEEQPPMEHDVLQILEDEDHAPLPPDVQPLPIRPSTNTTAPRAPPDNSRFFSESGRQIFIEGQRFLDANGEIVRRIANSGDLYVTSDGRELEIVIFEVEAMGEYTEGYLDRTDIAYLFCDGSESVYDYELASQLVDGQLVDEFGSQWVSAENFYHAWYDSDGNPNVEDYPYIPY